MEEDKKYTAIIGLETHVELKTASKMFCSCDADYFGKTPNTHVCPVCLGLPGALPVPNKQAIEWTILLGLALHCSVNKESKFDRKNYFYPDLPKGYQISQYDQPFCVNGYLEIPQTSNSKPSDSEGKQQKADSKSIRIRRVHLEEDTGKLLHTSGNQSRIDFNRSGVPLVEIVTEPDIRSSDEAVAFMKQLHAIVRSLGVSDADMEKGSMRIEPNISVLLANGSRNARATAESIIEEKDLPKYKVEVKNINSFRFAKRSIDFEVERHIKLLEQGETPKQETRGWNESKKATVSQRSKEEAADYRYFPEPDIPPVKFTDEEIEKIQRHLPMLPTQVEEQLVVEYKVRKEYAKLIAGDSKLYSFFIKSLNYEIIKSMNSDTLAGLIINKKVDITKVTPEIFIRKLASELQSKVSDEGEITKWIDEAFVQLPQAVSDYKSGRQQAIGVIIGKVMQLSKGKADAKQVQEIILKRI